METPQERDGDARGRVGEMLRVLREVSGLKRAQWAAALEMAQREILVERGTQDDQDLWGRTPILPRTTLRWERGDLLPRNDAEEAIVRVATERLLFRRATFEASTFRDTLAAARLAAGQRHETELIEEDDSAADEEELVEALDPTAAGLSEGEQRALVPVDRPEHAELAAPSRETTQALGTTLAGARLYLIILAATVAVVIIGVAIVNRLVRPPADCTPNSRFVDDVNVPDGTVLEAGATFTKQWRMKNPDGGNVCPWTRGYNIVWKSGPNLGTGSSFDIQETPAGGETIISVPMRAPAAPGTYKSTWQLRTPEGRLFGDPDWVEIEAR